METEEGFDAGVWAELASQLELTGIAIPEQFGGSGFGIDAQVVVFEELGRELMCVPYLSTTLAVEALLASGDDEACGELLPAVAGGEADPRSRCSKATGASTRTRSLSEPPIWMAVHGSTGRSAS